MKFAKRTACARFKSALGDFVVGVGERATDANGEWAIKGLVDACRQVYPLSPDSKLLSKAIEIHLLPELLGFANEHGYDIVPAEHQNTYPDISFVSNANSEIKFAVDFKTSYRLPDKPTLCNGFTLGSHGRYFTDRSSRKNIQFPYSQYAGHFCLGAIYTRQGAVGIGEKYPISRVGDIKSVASDLQFFVAEKWRIAADKSGSGNTANIGSIRHIQDILDERGMFSKLGEKWFDDYWTNYNKILAADGNGELKKINSLAEFVRYRRGDVSRIVAKRS